MVIGYYNHLILSPGLKPPTHIHIKGNLRSGILFFRDRARKGTPDTIS